MSSVDTKSNTNFQLYGKLLVVLNLPAQIDTIYIYATEKEIKMHSKLFQMKCFDVLW